MTGFKSWTIMNRLNYILDNPEKVNRSTGCFRSVYLTEALAAARDILPDGPEKRGLDYVVRNTEARFYFGGKDIIAPAIRKAIAMAPEEWDYLSRYDALKKVV